MSAPAQDPLAGSPWSNPAMVEGFAAGAPNPQLVAFARDEYSRVSHHRVLDIGCGAGRNAVPLAAEGWRVLGLDLSLPMVTAGAVRARRDGVDGRLTFALAPMHHLPVASRSCDLIVAHGIWNLARSGREFRAALQEASRAAAAGAGLFVFTFSRSTLADDAAPIAGETFVFTQFSGEPQCFLTREQLLDELASVGFTPDQAVPLRELNRRPPEALTTSGPPVIWEGTFRATG